MLGLVQVSMYPRLGFTTLFLMHYLFCVVRFDSIAFRTFTRTQIMERSLMFAIASLLIAQLLSCQGIHDFTFVADAIPKRAVCIDGTRAGYYHALGSGDGINNWIVYLMGGGWCNNYSTCRRRSLGLLGSTKHMKPVNFSGILSSNQEINPDFYNWNRVYVHYCDGSSFIGDIGVTHRGSHLQLRGSRIFNAVINELLQKGMSSANNALLAGGSAGGLATILNCDDFRTRLPNSNTVKCVSDAGFFIRGKNVPDAGHRERRFDSTVRFHNLTNFLAKSCTSRMSSRLCLFPENLVEPWKGWKTCTKNLSKCTHPHKRLIKDFGNAFLETLMNIGDNPSRGMFINACYAHTYTDSDEYWNSKGSPRLENKTISEAVGDWYFDRSCVKLIDRNTHFPFN